MASLPELIGLLYRADWTRLSLSAELRSETGGEPPPHLSRERWPGWGRAWPGQKQQNGPWPRRGERRRARLVMAAAGKGWPTATPGEGERRLSAGARAVLPLLPARRVHPGRAGAGDRRGPRRDCGRGHAAP